MKKKIRNQQHRTQKTIGKNQWNQILVLWKINIVNKTLAKLIEKEKENVKLLTPVKKEGRDLCQINLKNRGCLGGLVG